MKNINFSELNLSVKRGINMLRQKTIDKYRREFNFLQEEAEKHYNGDWKHIQKSGLLDQLFNLSSTETNHIIDLFVQNHDQLYTALHWDFPDWMREYAQTYGREKAKEAQARAEGYSKVRKRKKVTKVIAVALILTIFIITVTAVICASVL